MKNLLYMSLLFVFASQICGQSYQDIAFDNWFQLDFHYVNRLEAEGKYDEADEWYETLRDAEFAKFISSKRAILRSGDYSWSFSEPTDLYSLIVTAIEDKTSISNLLPPSISGYVLATEMFFAFDNSDYSDILTTYTSEVHISDLVHYNSYYYFVISVPREQDSASWYSFYESAVVVIKQISDSIYEELNGRFEITRIDWTDTMNPETIRSSIRDVGGVIPVLTRFLYGITEKYAEAK